MKSLVSNQSNYLYLKIKEQGNHLKDLIVRLFQHQNPTSPLQSEPSTRPLQIVIHETTGTLTSSSLPQATSSMLSSVSSSTMAQTPWNNLGEVLMPNPLSQLSGHLEKWLPKINPEAGMLAEEHINNFMLSINLNGVINEDVVV